MMNMADTAGRIRSLRAFRNISARVLAERAGMTRGVIANIETGRRDYLDVSELIALSTALNVSALDLVPELAAVATPARAPWLPTTESEPQHGN